MRKGIKTDKDLIRYGINPIIWHIHFTRRPDKAKCEDCLDYLSNLCKGGKNPLECMREKSNYPMIIGSCGAS